jgi:hypothetical protein
MARAILDREIDAAIRPFGIERFTSSLVAAE